VTPRADDPQPTRPIAVFPDPAPIEIARTLDLSGYAWKAVRTVEALERLEPERGWGGAVVDCSEDPEGGWGICRALRDRDPAVVRVLVLVTGAQVGDLESRDHLFQDFCLAPVHPRELDARLRHLCADPREVDPESIVAFGGLELNLETYQATFDGRPLDLTYMEYELLKFLTMHAGKVVSRETLLSRVWGYEYFGGARTVDVHVRRLRAKLGEEHAHLIQTVRNVGYRLGQTRQTRQTRQTWQTRHER
jgi:DNA-binding response OmpR family regulator